MAKRTAPKPTPHRASDAGAFAIRYLGRDSKEVTLHGQIDEATALRCDYIVRNRERWIQDPDSRLDQEAAATELLRKSLVDRDGKPLDEEALGEHLDAASANGLVEVAGVVPDDGAAASTGIAPWALMPWEHILSAAARSYREALGAPPLTVMRRVAGIAVKERERDFIKKVIFVECAPGRIGDLFDFAEERALVESSLDPTESFMLLRNPRLKDLADAIEAEQPDAVHFTGMDVHQGRSRLALEGEGPRGRGGDGFFLADDAGQPKEETASAIGTALRKAGPNLRLVAFNGYNTAARCAPLAVAGGAAAAVGFQDEIDDRAAESFFSRLYFAWRQESIRLEQAFAWAMSGLPQQVRRVRGTGVALWGDRPWELGEVASDRRTTAQRLQDLESEKVRPILRAPKEWRPAEGSAEGKGKGRGKNPSKGKGTPEALAPAVAASAPSAALAAAGPTPPPSVRLDPRKRLNYAMLHNGRSLFDTFAVGRVAGCCDEVRVRVHLHSGMSEVGAYESVVKLDDAVHDLRDQIQLPLLSTLWRSMREGVRTTATVTVTELGRRAEKVVHLATYPVTLLPPEEWADTDEDRAWLPSFVLPRDEAVRGVIDHAEKYLRSLTDDRDASFDGYQSLPPPKGLDPEERYEPIDMQVRAIWSALVFDYGIRYINPPPTYTEQSQRLRRPSDIIAGNRGTCIDLALLFAACLEYVEIYPALFLIEGHAFPGYWRDDTAHQDFVTMAKAERPALDRAGVTGLEVPEFGWCVEKSSFGEIRALLDRSVLAPVETTTICFGGAFYQSLDEGLDNLSNPDEFNAMLDIVTARRAGVTPVPMAGPGE